MIIKNSEKGQTLLEAVIALSVLVITLAAIAISIVIALNNSIFLKNQNLANKYAQEGIEHIRNLKITDFGEYKLKATVGSVYCLDGSFEFSPLPCIINVGSFKRDVRFESGGGCGSGGIETIVSVRWTSGKCPTSGLDNYCHKAQVSSCFYDDSVQP